MSHLKRDVPSKKAIVDACLDVMHEIIWFWQWFIESHFCTLPLTESRAFVIQYRNNTVQLNSVMQCRDANDALWLSVTRGLRNLMWHSQWKEDLGCRGRVYAQHALYVQLRGTRGLNCKSGRFTLNHSACFFANFKRRVLFHPDAESVLLIPARMPLHYMASACGSWTQFCCRKISL